MPHTCNSTGLGLSNVARISTSQKHQEAKGGGGGKSTFGLALFSCIQVRNTARNVIAIGNIRKYGNDRLDNFPIYLS